MKYNSNEKKKSSCTEAWEKKKIGLAAKRIDWSVYRKQTLKILALVNWLFSINLCVC